MARKSSSGSPAAAPAPPRPRFPEHATFIGRPLREAFMRMIDEVNAGMATHYDFATPAINRAMIVIDGEGTRLTVLADRLQMTKQSAGELVDRMVEIGLVERRPDPTDGRAKLVCLTDEGWEAMRVGLGVALDLHRHWEGVLGAAKTRELIGLLEELVAGLDAEGLDEGLDAEG